MNTDRINFHSVEKKWQKKFLSSNLYREKGKKVLLFRNVSLSIG